MKGLIILLIHSVCVNIADGQCPGNQFRCEDGRCINRVQVCDEKVDCRGLDISDETAPECREGDWASWNGHEYLVPRFSTQKSRAALHCERQQSQMVQLETPEEQQFVYSQGRSFKITSLFRLGIHRISPEECRLGPEICGMPERWQWDDGSPVEWVSWNHRSPAQPNAGGPCVTLYSYNVPVISWTDGNCETGNSGFICERKDHGEWRMWNGHEYYFSVNDTTAPRASRACHSRFSEITSVLTQEENDYLTQYISDSDGTWIGLTRDNSDDPTWQWMETPAPSVTYTNWGPSEPSQPGGNASWVYMQNDGNWVTADDTVRLPFVCKRAPVLWEEFNHNEYFLSTYATTFSKARATCSSYNGDLTSIESAEEFEFLTSHLSDSRAWIGLQKVYNITVTWKWLDYSRITFQQWYADPGVKPDICIELVVPPESSTNTSGWRYEKCLKKRRFFCKRRPCAKSQYRCGHAICISATKRCDGKDDCGDGSDERNCDVTCGTSGVQEFECGNGLCIPYGLVCDGWDHCGDRSDEDGTFCDGRCEEGEYRCDNGRCISTYLLCDFDNNCGDLSDEPNCRSYRCRSDLFKCRRNTLCISPARVCDGEPNCWDSSDEVNCIARIQCKKNEFKCDSGTCININFQCDGVENCDDGSDEKIENCKCARNEFRTRCSDCGFCRGNAVCYLNNGRCPLDECEYGFTGEKCLRDVDGWLEFNDAFYKISAFLAMRPTAIDFCHYYGGELTSVLTQEEQDFLASKGSSGSHYWIGLERDARNMWNWLDESFIGYTRWGNNQPAGSGDCARMYVPASKSDASWSNTECKFTANHFICKRDLRVTVDVSWCEQATVKFWGWESGNGTASYYLLEYRELSGESWYFTKIPLGSTNDKGEFIRRYSFLPGDATFSFRSVQYGKAYGSNEVTRLMVTPFVNGRIVSCLN